MRAATCLSLLLLGAFAAPPAPARAAAPDAALGSEGELYSVRAGTVGELFPAAPGMDLENTVLALEVVRPGGERSRIPVPDTEGPEVEASPSLVFEPASGTVYVVWESRVNLVFPLLMLAGYSDGDWSERIPIYGNYTAPKTRPQLVVTRDSYSTGGTNGPVSRSRTILHLLWSEEQGNGEYRAHYTPVVLEDGVYMGASPIYRLDDFDYANGAIDAAVSPDLARAPVLEQGRDSATVVAAFASAATGQVVTVEIRALPPQLSRIADGARAHIIGLGNRATLAAQARSWLLANGTDFESEVLLALAELVYAELRSDSEGDIVSLADRARAHIIGLGSRLTHDGLKLATANVATPEIHEVRTSNADPGSAAHLLRVHVVSRRPVPELGAGETRLFVAESGRDVLVSWLADDGRLYYRDSRADGWGGVHELAMAAGFDLGRAYEILAQRVDNR